MKIEYTPERGRGFVRPGETEKQQNWGFSGIKKAAPIRSRLSEQLTYCAKNEYKQWNYISQVTKRHNCRITGKTKATGGGRQWENTKHKPGHHSDLLAGGQCDQCAGLLVDCQPFGTIPRCCNSLRIIRFIQAARESSPSCCCAFSIFSRKSGSKRNWNGGLPRLSFLCVDTLITPHIMYLCVVTHYTQSAQKAKPRKCRYHSQGF
ncbi:hypothetical protein O5621_14865 [Escherichia coli]|nr:hypothetical protein [Escherichia coli]